MLHPFPPPRVPLAEQCVIQVRLSPANSIAHLSPGSLQSKLRYTTSMSEIQRTPIGASGSSPRMVNVLVHYSQEQGAASEMNCVKDGHEEVEEMGALPLRGGENVSVLLYHHKEQGIEAVWNGEQEATDLGKLMGAKD